MRENLEIFDNQGRGGGGGGGVHGHAPHPPKSETSS